MDALALGPSEQSPSAAEPNFRDASCSGLKFLSGVASDCGGKTSGNVLEMLVVHIRMLRSWPPFMTSLSFCDTEYPALPISSSPDRSASRDGHPRLPPSTARRIGDGSDDGMDMAVRSPEESRAASNSACPREHKLKSSEGADGPAAPFGIGN